MAAKLRKGDFVIVRTGRDKGKTGKILKVDPREGTAVVEKINVVKRHQKARQGGGPSGIMEKALPLCLSKLALVDSKTQKATRVRFDVKDDKKVRIAVKSKEIVAA